MCLRLHTFILFLLKSGLFCNRTFDRYACWPDTPAGVMINISCPFYLPWYDKGNNKKLSVSVSLSFFPFSSCQSLLITGQ
uniref:G-protein coupled receptors family 2 profile 1 domain-containing protein n=1 Tax=Neolamprologus brichardi TaxID=32507 RepID=A0A3Q4I5S5_NEOBR